MMERWRLPRQRKATFVMLLGREAEVGQIRQLVGGIRERGGVLLLIGDPGIGKSELAGTARQFAARQDVRVVTATGVPAESRLPYAGLHQMLRQFSGGIEELPEPQRSALLSAFGKGTSKTPDRFLVELAVTNLLTAAAAGQPLLVLADDAHWLDPATCDALAFLARRIDDEPIVLVATARDGYQTPLLEVGLPELHLASLTEDAAGRLLDSVAPELDAVMRREILAISLGNPLALHELSRNALRADADLTAIPAGAEAIALTSRIEKAFAARWSDLPEPTRTVLVIAALNESGTLGETLEAASLVKGARVTVEAVTPAIAARLVEAGPAKIRFRHPLVRSAIQYRAGLSQITAAHQALATVLKDEVDRRAWHRAAATLRPDEEVAAELDELAARAVRQAAIRVGITALERAVELSTDPAALNSRLVRAAQLSSELGRPALVERFARSVDRTGLNLTDRARLALLQESVDTGPPEGGERIHYLIELAREVAANGPADLALDLLLGAAQRCWWADPGRETRVLVATTALELAGDQRNAALPNIVAYTAPDLYGALVRDQLAGASPDAGLDAVQLTYLGCAGTTLGAFGKARMLLATAIPQLRAQYRFGLLVQALHHDATSAAYSGQWDDSVAASDECERVAAETGQYRWVAMSQAAKALVAGLRGDDTELGRLASEAEKALLPDAGGSGMALLQIGRGLAALGRRDYQVAYAHLRRIFNHADGAYHHQLRRYHVGDLADAATHSNHRDEARALIAEFAPEAAQEREPLLAVNVTFGRALLADDEDADEQFGLALTEEMRHWPFYYARLELEYGGWLRRHRQPARARQYLRDSRDVLDAIGARSWRDRADAELRASGEVRRVPDARASQWQQLTGQEQQIAEMVLAGLTNREIGGRLHVSHRTVAYHLYRMFPRLGITCRAELAVVLAEAGALTPTKAAC